MPGAFYAASTRDAGFLLVALVGVGLILTGRRLALADRAIRALDAIHPQ